MKIRYILSLLLLVAIAGYMTGAHEPPDPVCHAYRGQGEWLDWPCDARTLKTWMRRVRAASCVRVTPERNVFVCEGVR